MFETGTAVTLSGTGLQFSALDMAWFRSGSLRTKAGRGGREGAGGERRG